MRFAERHASTAMGVYHEIVRRCLPDVEFHQNRYARELHPAVFPGCRWLDIGAGARLHGGWLRPCQEELGARAGFLCGCDLVAEHLAAHPHLDGRVVAHGTGLPFPDNCFDVVTANMVLEHLAEPGRVLAEVARVLRPGGRFVFVTPTETIRSFGRRRRWFLRRGAGCSRDGWRGVRSNTSSRLITAPTPDAMSTRWQPQPDCERATSRYSPHIRCCAGHGSSPCSRCCGFERCGGHGCGGWRRTWSGRSRSRRGRDAFARPSVRPRVARPRGDQCRAAPHRHAATPAPPSRAA